MAQARLQTRLTGLFTAVIAIAPLLIASMLRPDARGHGSHEQLGLPACGWAAALDAPCPTCGMTTSFTHAAGGDITAAVANQPMGGLLAVLAAATFWAGLHAALTASDLGRVVKPLGRAPVLWIGVGILLASWAYKLFTWGGPAVGS